MATPKSHRIHHLRIMSVCERCCANLSIREVFMDKLKLYVLVVREEINKAIRITLKVMDANNPSNRCGPTDGPWHSATLLL